MVEGESRTFRKTRHASETPEFRAVDVELVQRTHDASGGVVHVRFRTAEGGMPRAVAGTVHIITELAVAIFAATTAGEAVIVCLAGGAEIRTVSELTDQAVSSPGITGAAGTPHGAAGLGKRGEADQQHARRQK